MAAKKSVSKKLKAQLERRRKLLDDADRRGADVALAKELYKEAERCLKEGDETEVKRILDNIDLMIKHAKSKRKYEMMIFNSLPIIEKAKAAGADVSYAEELLQKARDLLDEGEFGDAHEQIKLARREADDAKRFMNTKALIQSFVPEVEAAKRKGVDIKEATKVIMKSWEALNQRNYGVVKGLIKEAKNSLEVAEEHKRYADSVKEAEARIDGVAEAGMDTKVMSDLLKDAQHNLERSNYADVRTLVNKIHREIEKILLKREAGLTVRTIEQFIRTAKKAGIGSKELEGMLEKAAVALDKGDFSEVQSIELDAKQVVRNLKLFDTLSAGDIGVLDKDREDGFVALIHQELEDSKVLVDSARAGGVDVSEVEGLISKAEGALGANQFDQAFDAVRGIRSILQDEEGGFQAVGLKKSVESVQSKLAEAREIGVDVEEVETLIGQIETMAEQGFVSGADEIVKQANLALENAARKQLEGKYPRLKVSVHSDALETQRWNRATVELSNVGQNIAKNIDLDFHGDVEVKGWETVPKLSPGDKESRDISLKSYKPGKVPIDITVSYKRSFDNTKYQLNDLSQVDVQEAGSFLVEDAFLIYNNGLLISRQTRRLKEDVDGDLFSAMLTAISQFAKESFRLEDKVALNRLEFGDSQVVIERGSTFFIAVTILGEESIYMPFYMAEIVQEIEDKYGDVLQAWEGDLSLLDGVDEIVKKLLLIKVTETGIPEMSTSIIHPVLEAMREGAEIPHFEENIMELLSTFEEELISGDLGETTELVRSIKEVVDSSLKGVSVPGMEEKRRELILKESVSAEVESVRNLMLEAKNSGTDVSQEEGLLGESLNSLDKGQFELARKALGNIRGSLKGKRASKVTENYAKELEEIKTTIELAQQVGLDISEVATMSGEADQMLEGEDTQALGEMMSRIRGRLGQATKGFIENKYPKLQVQVERGRGYEEGGWNPMTLVLTNKGNTPARNVDINFTGDVEVKGLGPVEVIEPGARRHVGFSVRPSKSGKLPMDVSASYQRFFDDTKYQLNDMKEIDVDVPGTYIVEDAFLIHMTGILIAKETRRLQEGVDSDVFGAMLTALTDFVREAFKLPEKSGLDRLEFGGNRVLIERGEHVYLALSISGEESIYLPFYMTELIKEIEEKYGEVLDGWNGEMKRLGGIDEHLKKIIFIRKDPETQLHLYEGSMLYPALGTEGGVPQEVVGQVSAKVAELTNVVEGEGFAAARQFLGEMSGLIGKLATIPPGEGAEAVSIDAGALKKRMYDLMIRSGRVEKDSALMDARLTNYMDVIGTLSDAVYELREANGIPLEQTLARVAVKHQDYERWGEVFTNMRTLILEQVNAKDVILLTPDEVWNGLVPDIQVNVELIRASYKHIAGKIVSVLKFMPPDKLLANLRKGTFTIGVEGQQIYISNEMVGIDFSLPEGAVEGEADWGVIYLDTVITEEMMSEIRVNELIAQILTMRADLELGEEAKVEVQIFAGDKLADELEKWKDEIAKKTNAYEVVFPLDDPFDNEDYYVCETELDNEPCKIGIVQVEEE